MSKYLLSHGHLVLDGKREYLDGAILFEDNKLLQIYPHSNHIHTLDCEEIDLHGQLVFPMYNGTINKEKFCAYNPAKEDSLLKLLELSHNTEYIVMKDSDSGLTELVLKILPINRVILTSSNPSKTMNRLHEQGFTYSDLSKMFYVNLQKSQGNNRIAVKGNPINFIVMDHKFNTIFRIVNGEFTYD